MRQQHWAKAARQQLATAEARRGPAGGGTRVSGAADGRRVREEGEDSLVGQPEGERKLQPLAQDLHLKRRRVDARRVARDLPRKGLGEAKSAGWQRMAEQRRLEAEEVDVAVEQRDHLEGVGFGREQRRREQ